MKTKILISLIVFGLIFSFQVEAQETQVFFDDFEKGIEKWDMPSGWEVVEEEDNRVLRGREHTFATADLEGLPNKLELKLKILKGTLHINIRSKNTAEGMNRYFISFDKDWTTINKQLGDDFQHLTDGQTISFNQWHNIKIEIVDEEIKVFSDNDLIVSFRDENLIEEGGVSFETLEESVALIDDVRVEVVVPEEKEIKAKDLFIGGKHEGDITLKEREFLILEKGEFEQFGNIYLKDSAKLIIAQATLKITRYQRLLNHWGIILQDRASLKIENSKLIPGDGTLFIVNVYDRSRLEMKDSPTQIHYINVGNSSRAVIENSEVVGEIGGLIITSERAEVKITNSRIGAVNLDIPQGAVFETEGLRTGFFEKWNLHENAKTSGIDYNITLVNTTLVKDMIGPGPYERGWPVFIDSSATVKIKDSELRKVVLRLYDEKAEFSNLTLETPSNFSYRNINLENVIVKGQWGMFPHGSSDVIVRDSEAFWTFIYNDSKLTLINTHMNEFDPRDFFGEIIFENCRWDTAAEIIENNDFLMKGSLKIGEIGGFSWEDSKVTRVYDLIGKPNTELTLRKGEEIIWQGKADEAGRASFNLKFDDQTFDDSWELKDNLGNRMEVSFFSKTPLKLGQNIILSFIEEVKDKTPRVPLQLVIYQIYFHLFKENLVFAIFFVLVILGLVIFFLRKKYFKK